VVAGTVVAADETAELDGATVTPSTVASVVVELRATDVVPRPVVLGGGDAVVDELVVEVPQADENDTMPRTSASQMYRQSWRLNHHRLAG
jgi:hypothetical protein